MSGGKLYAVRAEKQVIDLATNQPLAAPALDKLRQAHPGVVLWRGKRAPDKATMTMRWITGDKKFTLTSPDRLFSQYFNYVGRHAYVNLGRTIEIYDLRTGKLALQIATDLNDHHAWIAFLPDGTYTGPEGCEKLWGKKLGARNTAKVAHTLIDVLDIDEPGEPAKPLVHWVD